MVTAFLDALHGLYERDLNRLYTEIQSYPEEALLWKVDGQIANAGGNLCLHLCGNLQLYIGKTLGGIDYLRDREHEFAAKDIPRSRLLDEIQKTRHAVLDTLPRLDATVLEKIYPMAVFDTPVTTVRMLVHLQGHLNYHLGQINYHRRLLSKSAG